MSFRGHLVLAAFSSSAVKKSSVLEMKTFNQTCMWSGIKCHFDFFLRRHTYPFNTEKSFQICSKFGNVNSATSQERELAAHRVLGAHFLLRVIIRSFVKIELYLVPGISISEHKTRILRCQSALGSAAVLIGAVCASPSL